jgi:hypothetical protein
VTVHASCSITPSFTLLHTLLTVLCICHPVNELYVTAVFLCSQAAMWWLVWGQQQALQEAPRLPSSSCSECICCSQGYMHVWVSSAHPIHGKGSMP